MVRTKWYGQNGMDKMVWTKWYGQNGMDKIHSFMHSGDLYSASSRDYYSEALPAQPRTKQKDLREM